MRNISRNYKIYFYSLLIVLLLTNGRIFPQSDSALESKIRLAQGYETSGQFEKAEEMYREIVAEKPVDYFFFESLNRVLVAQKKYDQSIDLINKRIKQTPQDYNLFGILGSTYYIMGQSQKAYDTWENGIDLDPKSYVGYRTMANYAIEDRAFDKAIDLLNRGKQYASDPIIFSMDLASIYSVNMRFADAAKEFCELIEKNPLYLQTVKTRMTTYLNRVEAADQTIAVVKEYAESKKQKEFYELLTFIYQTVQNYPEAFKTIVETDKQFDGNGTSIFLFAQDAYRNRQYEWASKAYNLILENYKASSFTLAAEIGYAKTLEASLNEKYDEQNQSWKPYTKHVPMLIDEYKKIISAYELFINNHSGNAITTEAMFRVAEIYRTRIQDFTKAENLYDKIINNSSVTSYAVQSLLSKGKMKVESGDLKSAKELYEQVLHMKQATPDDIAISKYMLAKISFWKGDFQNALVILNDVTNNLSTDFANDALELSALINSTKKDSLNLFKYAESDLLIIQNKSQTALIELKTLADNQNVFIINDFAKIRIAEIFISENDFLNAIDFLEKLANDQKNVIFIEKSTFLLARCLEYGTKDLPKAVETYEKILENFPNSLYFDRVREELNRIQTKSGKK